VCPESAPLSKTFRLAAFFAALAKKFQKWYPKKNDMKKVKTQ